MSEVLEEYSKRKLDWQLKVSSEAPLTYVRQQVDLFNKIQDSRLSQNVGSARRIQQKKVRLAIESMF